MGMDFFYLPSEHVWELDVYSLVSFALLATLVVLVALTIVFVIRFILSIVLG